MLQDIKDEVLSGEPRYTIRDNQGNILQDNVDIELKTPIIQEGTPLNKATLDTLKIETVGAGLLMNGGAENTYGISGNINSADYTNIVETKVNNIQFVKNSNFSKMSNFKLNANGGAGYPTYCFSLDETHFVIFYTSSSNHIFADILELNENTTAKIKSSTLSVESSFSITDAIRISNNKFILAYSYTKKSSAVIVNISDNFDITFGTPIVLKTSSSRYGESYLVAADENSFFALTDISLVPGYSLYLAKYAVNDNSISLIQTKSILTDGYTGYSAIIDLNDKIGAIYSYNTSNGGTFSCYQKIYNKNDFSQAYSGVIANFPAHSFGYSKLYKIGNYYVTGKNSLYLFTYNNTKLNYNSEKTYTFNGNSLVKIVGVFDDNLICILTNDSSSYYLFINNLNNSAKSKHMQLLYLGSDNTDISTAERYSSFDKSYSDCLNGWVIPASCSRTDSALWCMPCKLTELLCKKANSLQESDGIIKSISGNIATVYERANVNIS